MTLVVRHGFYFYMLKGPRKTGDFRKLFQERKIDYVVKN